VTRTPASRVVVVGACGGIGRAAVDRFRDDGAAAIACLDLPGPALDAVASSASVAWSASIDLADPASVAAAFGAVRERMPDGIDALVVSSGVVDNAKLADITRERWDRILAVNLTGAFLCLLEARPLLRDGGSVVLLGSLAGRTGGVLTGTAYAVSKGGIESLAKSAAQEFAPRGITVNCVAPGIVDTPMLAAHTEERKAGMARATPLGRLGRPEEVAGTIAWLCSPAGAYVTGAVIPVNGGLRMD